MPCKWFQGEKRAVQQCISSIISSSISSSSPNACAVWANKAFSFFFCFKLLTSVCA